MELDTIKSFFWIVQFQALLDQEVPLRQCFLSLVCLTQTKMELM